MADPFPAYASHAAGAALGSDPADLERLLDTPTPGAEELSISRFALFAGRPLYWRVTQGATQAEHGHRAIALMRWALTLPGARVGLSPEGLGRLVRSVLSLGGRALPSDLDDLLDTVGATESGTVVLQRDREIWEPHLGFMLDQLQQAKSQGRYIWIRPEEAAWWLDATESSLQSYAALELQPSMHLRLLSRHRCTVFGSVDAEALVQHLAPLADDPDFAQRYAQVAQDISARWSSLTGRPLSEAYWSWQMLNFSNVGSIIYTPLLALWSDWPNHSRFAPPRPSGYQPPQPLPCTRVAAALEEVFWQGIETLFLAARSLNKVGVTEPTFVDRDIRPPVFYYAAPVAPPLQPEAYLDARAAAIEPLLTTCLAAKDPFSDEVAWGTMDGSMMTVRREMIRATSVQPWYLVLPTAAKRSAGNLEEAIGDTASNLTFLEFSIGRGGRDVVTDVQSVGSRRSLWAGMLEAVNDTTAQGMDLVSTVSERNLRRINGVLTDLYLLLQRLQQEVEDVSTESVQLRSTFENYIDNLDDYMRRTMTFSRLRDAHVHSLRAALADAYPYHYLKEPLQALQRGMDQLRDGLERTTDSMSAVFARSGERGNGQSSALGRLTTLLIGLLGLLLAAGQITASAQSSSLSATDFGQFVIRELAANIVTLLIPVVGIVIAAIVGLTLTQQVPHRPSWFVRRAQALGTMLKQAADVAEARNLPAEPENGAGAGQAATKRPRWRLGSTREPESAAQVWQRMDELDEKATQLLETLWEHLDELGARTSSNALTDWLRVARLLEYRINLFALSPEMIVLPRTLCVFRYGTEQFFRYAVVSDWDFEASLNVAGFPHDTVRRLDVWLSAPENQARILQTSVQAFVAALKEHGVHVHPDANAVQRWQGVLDLPPRKSKRHARKQH